MHSNICGIFKSSTTCILPVSKLLNIVFDVRIVKLSCYFQNKNGDQFSGVLDKNIDVVSYLSSNECRRDKYNYSISSKIYVIK